MLRELLPVICTHLVVLTPQVAALIDGTRELLFLGIAGVPQFVALLCEHASLSREVLLIGPQLLLLLCELLDFLLLLHDAAVGAYELLTQRLRFAFNAIPVDHDRQLLGIRTYELLFSVSCL